MSAIGRIRKMLRGSALVTPRAKSESAGFVFVVEVEGDLCGIGHTRALGDALANIIAAVPGVRPAFVWGTDVQGLEKLVYNLARATLTDKGAGNGWFHCSVEAARNAILTAATSSGAPAPTIFDMQVRNPTQ
jgi:hypothetical protein